jgi:hypothetical protein
MREAAMRMARFGFCLPPIVKVPPYIARLRPPTLDAGIVRLRSAFEDLWGTIGKSGSAQATLTITGTGYSITSRIVDGGAPQIDGINNHPGPADKGMGSCSR